MRNAWPIVGNLGSPTSERASISLGSRAVALGDVPDALRRLRRRAVTGKIVARVAPDA